VAATTTRSNPALSRFALQASAAAAMAVYSLSLLGSAYEVEGITMDANGFIYMVSDNGNTGTNSVLLVSATHR
jgi:tryptophan synthase alpha subunit